MIVTYCIVCNEFREGERECPECGSTRKGFESVMIEDEDGGAILKSDPNHRARRREQ